MDLACPKQHVTDILSDSDHSTEVALLPLSLFAYYRKKSIGSKIDSNFAFDVTDFILDRSLRSTFPKD